ncbi:hypothetical protein IFM89_029412 [Coptis chinensis]|uniref:Uncharacterized protein n=1 Tax=Coptis chinensis TaxID=261450 RepID=A0A835ISB9_9MAGN|nr:hypothetical protein IFM89_029412 [Coptis chinensis]
MLVVEPAKGNNYSIVEELQSWKSSSEAKLDFLMLQCAGVHVSWSRYGFRCPGYTKVCHQTPRMISLGPLLIKEGYALIGISSKKIISS